MSYGVTDRGFIPKPFSVILNELKQLARQQFGDDIDLGEHSRMLRFLELIAKRENDVWQLLEDVYYSAFIDFAQAESLDNIAALIGYKRYPARKATGKVIFSTSSPASDDVIIPEGTRVATADESVIFKTTKPAVLKAGETQVEAEIEAVEAGVKGNVAANTITKILDPVSGIESVNNPNPTAGGKDVESDEEFRYRIKTTIQSLGKATLDAILARVRNVEGVKAASIEENDTLNDYTSEGGLPPKSFRVFVWGGDDQAIAQAIFEAKPAGIQTYGSVSATAYDIDGNPHTIYFDRPTEVVIYVDVKVYAEGAVDPQEVKNAVKKYFESLGIGDDVIYNSLIANIMQVQGVKDVEVKIGKTSPPDQKTNIEIESKEIAVTSDDKITVTVV